MLLGKSLEEQPITFGGGYDYNYIVADVLDEGLYTDISSIENFFNYGILVVGLYPKFRDWKCMTREIKALALAKASGDINGNWNVFTDDEKYILCIAILTSISPANIASTYPSGPDRFNLSLNFDANSTIARENRYATMRIYLFSKIGTLNALNSLKFAETESLVSLYLGGIEGTIESGGIVGLNDYILSRPGTPYEFTGLLVQSYVIVDGSGDTLSDVCQTLVNMASKGIY